MSRDTDASISELTQDTSNAKTDSLDVHSENHNSSEDERNSPRCMFCSSFQPFQSKRASPEGTMIPLDLHQFLHEECSTCRPSDDSDTKLCDFCRHIRLRHLFDCRSKLQVDILEEYDRLELEVDFGGLDAIKQRQNCGLCRLVVDTISIHGQEVPKRNRPSRSSFAKLDVILLEDGERRLEVRSNLLKEAIDIAGKDFRPSASAPSWTGMRDILPTPLGKEISWDRIKKSLPNINPSPIGRLPSHFRLINIPERRCVTVGPSFDRTYAALSYVWGSPTGDDDKVRSVTNLRKPPLTIEDAMNACRSLGQDHLWVDQICIKQDDPTDKANQIASMAAIYSSASFVIVAARGESVHSGISGMQLARPKLQARESFLDFEFVSVPNFNRDISGSIWSTRGWTLQEVVLAEIRLYFSSTGVWINKKDETDSKYSVDFDQTEEPVIYRPSTFGEFSDHLQKYTSRTLTYDSDIYNAFSGITMALFGGPETDIYGLPEQHFDQALLWAPLQGGHPPTIRLFRNDLDQDPDLNPLLPTWSWASVTGEVDITEAGRFGDVIPLVKWARIAPRLQPPTLTLIEPQLEKGMWNQDYDLRPQFFLAVLWSHSCFDSPPPFARLQPDDNAQTNERKFRRRWSSPRDFWHEVSSKSSRSPKYPSLDILGLTGRDDFKIAQLEPGVLLTRAQFSHVWVDPDGYFRDGDHGALIGRLYGGDRGLILRGASPKAGVFKCVAISLAAEGSQMRHLIKRRKQESDKTQKGTVFDEESWDIKIQRGGSLNRFKSSPVINVMLIGREGLFSYRLGIGWILFRRWIVAKRIFETILLK